MIVFISAYGNISRIDKYLILLETQGSLRSTIDIFENIVASVDLQNYPFSSDLNPIYEVKANSTESTAFEMELSYENYNKLLNNPKIQAIEKVSTASVTDSRPLTFKESQEGFFFMNTNNNNTDIRIYPRFESSIENKDFRINKDISLWKSQKYAPWHLGRISSKQSNPMNFSPYGQEYYYPTSNNKVVVYVVDSGVDPSHSEFNGNVRLGNNFVTGENNDDNAGHGTAVAALINGKNNGVTKDASIVSVKVLNSENVGTTTMFYQGLNWVLNDKKANYPNTPAIVNFSINLEVESPTLEVAFKNLSNIGVLIVASSGNNSANQCDFFPGNSDHALIVSSVQPGNDSFDTLDSNFGPCIDVLAPGNRVFTAVAGSVNQVRPFIGTSFAAAIVTGIGASILSNDPTLSSTDLYDTIVGNAIENVISNVPADTANKVVWNGYSNIRSQFSYIK
ncbi:Subtilase-type proteinase psp3 [Smittium culicis]|uniref:Subtilase-type proteinase psp3 n=1 Tax=Smittium culicis TaxID=133412 RepID=A0A1R1XHD1_9FUNG|nr:Subtilase-type proteinase psp3 [Smittium culicis]